ncbi:hypothetical protein, partial [Mesorhizobium sp. M7A.F.Ca.CA.003.01.2.1]|uniref:hypothetical protein n=1 Tax=Mesorhizobium sp. M7A.F.Ca.CA.003.01.2.1 TaxID=2496722 RepID=UPI0019D1862F
SNAQTCAWPLPQTGYGFRGHALVFVEVAAHKRRAGPDARLFHVKNPGIPGFFRFFPAFSTWLRERFFLKSVSCRMSR